MNPYEEAEYGQYWMIKATIDDYRENIENFDSEELEKKYKDAERRARNWKVVAKNFYGLYQALKREAKEDYMMKRYRK